MLRKVLCWPANEASGRSSAVAEERTATGPSPRRRYASMTALASLSGVGASRGGFFDRSSGTVQRLSVVGVERLEEGTDARPKAGAVQELIIRVGRDNETGGHRGP